MHMPEHGTQIKAALVIDDDPLAVRLMSKVLETLGIEEVHSATNGVEGLEFLKKNDTDVGLIATDIEMPGLDGWELIRHIRFGEVERFQSIPIIVFTARHSESNALKSKFYKINGYIRKPPRIDNVSPILRDLGMMV